MIAGPNASIDPARRIRQQIWAKDMNVHAKLLALAVAEDMTASLQNDPSSKRLMRMCRITRRTYEKYMPDAREAFDVERRDGRSTLYRGRIEAVAEELTASIADTELGKRLFGEPPAKMTGGQTDTPRKNDRGAAEPTAQMTGGRDDTPRKARGGVEEPTAQMAGGQDATPRKVCGGSTEPTVNRAGGVSKRGPGHVHELELNPEVLSAANDVWFDEEERLQVANGFKTELEEQLKGLDLRAALDEIGGFVGINLNAAMLKREVRARAAGIANRRRDMDRRYEDGKKRRQRSRDEDADLAYLDRVERELGLDKGSRKT